MNRVKFLLRSIIAIIFIFSCFSPLYIYTLAAKQNYAIVYFENPHEISNYQRNSFEIIEIYDNFILTTLNDEKENYLREKGARYENLGDIHSIKIGKYVLSTSPDKNILYPPELEPYIHEPRSSEVPLYLINFIGPIKQEWRNILSQYGVNFYFYFHPYTYLIKGSKSLILSMKELRFIYAVGLYPSILKIDEQIFIEESKNLSLEILTTESLDLESFKTNFNIKESDISFSKEGNFSFLLLKEFPSDKILTISNYQDILHISLYKPPQTYNDDAAQVVKLRSFSDDHNSLVNGLEGEGEVVAVADTGFSTGNPLTVHEAFKDPTFYDKVVAAFPANDWRGYQSHGTHVAGTIAGTGRGHSSGSTRFRGMAPEAKFVFQNVWSPLYWDPLNRYFSDAYQADSNARVHSNSWGIGFTRSQYDVYSFEIDDFIWRNMDFSIIIAAANSRSYGSNSIQSFGTAKNCVTVGACENNKPIDPIAPKFPNRMASFSSIGPTHDGRMKPDVVAPGDWLVSAWIYGGYTDSLSNYYSWRGTSMATPTTAGSVAIIREYYRKIAGIPPENISSALLKATLINGCNTYDIYDHPNYGGEKLNLSSENFISGWGRVDIKNSLYPDSGNWLFYNEYAVDGTKGLKEGDLSRIYYVKVVDSTKPLKVSLVWTDYAVNAPKNYNDPTPDLINDLDLSVYLIDTDKYITYRGNQFDTNSNSILNPSKYDKLNNVELVNVENPLAGIYQIKVSAKTTIQSDTAHNFRQPFALVASGNIEQSAFPEPYPPAPINLKAITHCGKIELRWESPPNIKSPIVGYAIYRGELSSGNPPAEIAKVNEKTLNYIDEDITIDNRYYYYIKSFDDRGRFSDESNTVSAGEILPPFSPNLKGSADPLSIVLRWNAPKKGTCDIDGYAIYKGRVSDAESLEPILKVSSQTFTWADTEIEQGNTYSYFIRAFDLRGKYSPPSNEVSFAVPYGKPNLSISPELNRNEYFQNDEVIIKLSVRNIGTLACSNTSLFLYLPKEIIFKRADIRGIKRPDNSVEFDLGYLNIGSEITFYIFAQVQDKVSREKSVAIIFEVGCGAEIMERKIINALLKPGKNETKPLSISVYLKNTKVDPNTGEIYIDFDTPIELNLKITGGTSPYTLNIDWGDGSSKEKISIAEEKLLNLNHKFESKGLIEIKFEVIDSIGRSKKATVRIRVK